MGEWYAKLTAPSSVGTLTNGSYNTDFWSNDQWEAFGRNGGTVGLNGTLNYGNNTNYSDFTSQGGTGTMDWLGKNKDSIGTTAGLVGLGMNAYSQFFGQGKEAFDKQMKLYDQQIASNAEKMARRDALNKAWAGTVSPNGLAASYATKTV